MNRGPSDAMIPCSRFVDESLPDGIAPPGRGSASASPPLDLTNDHEPFQAVWLASGDVSYLVII